jgi:hypothetical protein
MDADCFLHQNLTHVTGVVKGKKFLAMNVDYLQNQIWENETFFIMALTGARNKYIHNFKKCGNPKMGFHRTMRRWCKNPKWQSYQILSVK